MEKWRCAVCGYVYNSEVGDPDGGIGPGVLFDELPESWGCPDCGTEKDLFEVFISEDDMTGEEGFPPESF
jgi:rubredoxin